MVYSSMEMLAFRPISDLRNNTSHYSYCVGAVLMIYTETTTLGDNIKQVLYRDESGFVIRDVCYNRSGIVITDELTEFNFNKKVLSIVIYGADPEKVIAYR